MGPGDAGGNGRAAGWWRRAPRSPPATRSSTSRPRRSPTCSRARSRGRCGGRLVGEGETVPVGALLGVVADSSVPDADLDALRRQVPGASSRRTPPRPARRGAGAGDDRGRRPAPALSRAGRGRGAAGGLHPRLRRRSQQLAVQSGGARREPRHLCARPARPWRLEQGSGRRPGRRRRARGGGGRFHGRQGDRQGASGRPFARRRDRARSGAQPPRAGRVGDR